MRAGSRQAWLVAVTMLVVVDSRLSAHRLDEYLQASRIAIEPDRANLELDLTPGVAVADAVIAEIDRDHDSSLAADEQQAYAARVLGAVVIELDGRPLRVRSMAATFPALDALRQGDVAIRLRAGAPLPPLSDGHHQLRFRNGYEPAVSVYLANALVPASDRIGVTGQRRDGGQRELTIDFVMRPGLASSVRTWLAVSLASTMVLAGLVMRYGPSR